MLLLAAPKQILEAAIAERKQWTAVEARANRVSRVCEGEGSNGHHDWLGYDSTLEVFQCRFCSQMQFLPCTWEKSIKPNKRYGVIMSKRMEEVMTGLKKEIKAVEKIEVGNIEMDYLLRHGQSQVEF